MVRLFIPGTDRRNVVAVNEPVAMALYQGHIYWVSASTNTLERVDKTSGNDRVIIKDQLDNVHDFIVVANNRPTGNIVSEFNLFIYINLNSAIFRFLV